MCNLFTTYKKKKGKGQQRQKCAAINLISFDQLFQLTWHATWAVLAQSSR